MTRDPIFIVGAPWSATSITRLLLNGHSNVAAPGETSFFPTIFDRCDDWPAGWYEAVATFMRRCERAFQPRIDLDSVLTELLATDADAGRQLSLPLQRWAAAQGKGRWGEKMPCAALKRRQHRNLQYHLIQYRPLERLRRSR